MKYQDEENLNYIVLTELVTETRGNITVARDFLNENEFNSKYWLLIDILSNVTGIIDESPAYNVYRDYKIMWNDANTEFYSTDKLSEYALSSIEVASKL